MSTFDAFWDYYRTRRTIPTLGGRNTIDVHTTGDQLIVGEDRVKPAKRSKNACMNDFNTRPVNADTLRGDRRYVEAAIKALEVSLAPSSPKITGASKVASAPASPSRATLAAEAGSAPTPRKEQLRNISTTDVNPCVCLCSLSRDFIAVLTKRHIKLTIAGSYPSQWINWCIRGAQIKPYRTNAQRLPIAAVLKDYLSICAGGSGYRTAWTSAVSSLVRLGFTIGQSQKLLNLLSKYCFAYYFSELDRDWINKNSWVRECAGAFDIPIDQIVLKNILKLYGTHPIAGGIYAHRGYGFICRHVHPRRNFAWNRLTCTDCYTELQDFVRHESHLKGYIFPMEFEMAELWP